ncbi:ABC transporter substrate-binding protein [Humibacter albus]|uniref:ABC transporter substrate-binding protein n=1 Tax=Humibacter albus TaxID=427754 RepID=UPI0003B4B16B|nr:sugar ABC transporter substrate-binding protein [Humibacter albus]
MASESTGAAFTRRGFLGLGAAAAATTMLAACSGGSGGSAASDDDIEKAMKKGGSITWWTWTPQAKKQLAAFEKAYPKVKVKLRNVGSGGTQYTKLSNAIKAGSGAPDVAQIEYFALPQFVLAKSLVELSDFGFGSLKKLYANGTWDSVNVNGGLYGLPQDYGPMAYFYNKTVYDKYGISVPTTWDEFVAAAKKLHAANPKLYLLNDAGDPGFTTSMIWQAGGRPFKVDGTTVTVDLQDSGTKKWTSTWDQLVEGKLLNQTTAWTDAWYAQLGNGEIASVVTGSWMPGILETSVAQASGQWRVAPIPTYDGTPANAANGGSSHAVLKQGKNQTLAAGFLKWLCANTTSTRIFREQGGFPSTKSDLSASAWLSDAPAYFGGQKINKVLADASDSVLSGWQYLPYQQYANSVYSDAMSASYSNNTSLNPGLQAWQKAIVSYGNKQGFKVTGK